MTKEYVEQLTDKVLLEQYSERFGQSVFSDKEWIKNDVEVLKAEILRRMKKN